MTGNINPDIDYISTNLLAYLKHELANPALEFASTLTPLQGGYETSIYRFSLKGIADKLSGLLVLRLYPAFYGTHNAIWESTVQNALSATGYPVAKAHVVCTDLSILGGAFFVMDYLPGQPLFFASPDAAPELLGKNHAELHNIDPDPLIATLNKQRVDGYGYSLNSRFDWLTERANTHSWIRESVNWLVDHRPPEPAQLAVCHGDYHALNILVNDDQITGVLDWQGFTITDPIYDVANTVVLSTIPAKHLTASIDGFPTIDWNLFVEGYLSAYQTQRQLDRTHLDYYKIRRCVMALIQGAEGQKVWQHPLIVADLVAQIQAITGIQVEVSLS